MIDSLMDLEGPGGMSRVHLASVYQGHWGILIRASPSTDVSQEMFMAELGEAIYRLHTTISAVEDSRRLGGG